MKTFVKTPESKSVIRFPDCDPFNHLNNSKYIDYIINAREDQLIKHYELDVYKLAREKGISWVVAQNQIAYLSPAVLMETVTVQTHLVYYDEKRLFLEAVMWNEEKTTIKAVLWTQFVHFNLVRKKSETHSEELTALFEQVVDPFPTRISFEERVKLLRTNPVL